MNFFNIFSDIVITALKFVIGLFPAVNTQVLSNISIGSSQFHTYLQQASFLFPAGNLLLILGFMIAVEVSLFSYRLIKLIIGYLSLGNIKD
jgi:hypothetical protein